MNWIKWLRKNNTKVMAVVVIVLMIGFIGGSSLDYLLRSNRGLHGTTAYFADNKKITQYDQIIARQELDILRALHAGTLLRSQDLRGMLLGELLFAEGRGVPAMVNMMKRTVMTNQYRVGDRQIEDLYRRSAGTEIYWILLKNEAQSAGISIPNRDVAELLVRIIPQMFEGQTYSQVMAVLVNQNGVPEEQVLATFGKLLAVLQYGYVTCSMGDLTDSQIRHTARRENETLDVESIRFDSAVFAKTMSEPREEDIAAHFEKYKKFFIGQISEENPYGFGYKLPDRVRLEYVAVKLDDVSTIVKPPTEEEAEQFYQKNREQLFTEQVAKDPNDPNSPVVKQTKGYAEVSSAILKQMQQDRINSKAEQILLEVRIITDSGLVVTDVQDANLTSEHLKKLAGDYPKAAEEVSKKHGIILYSGQTGLLNGMDMQSNEQLGRLYVTPYGYSSVRLSQTVFSVTELEPNEPAPLYSQKPKMYESIGPAKDLMAQMSGDSSGRIMALVRITDVQKACEPVSIDASFSTKTLELGPSTKTENKGVYSVREKVVEDMKRLAALETTKKKAEEFCDLVRKDGWDNSLKKFNELYGRQAAKDPNDPNAFKFETLAGLQRISRSKLETVAAQSAGNAAARWILDQARLQEQFVNQLFLLVPQDSNTVKQTPLVFEFKPNLSEYCVKSITVKRFSQESYQSVKAMQAVKESQIQSQSLAAVHFNPDKILKRMNFRPAKERTRPAETEIPLEQETDL